MSNETTNNIFGYQTRQKDLTVRTIPKTFFLTSKLYPLSFSDSLYLDMNRTLDVALRDVEKASQFFRDTATTDVVEIQASLRTLLREMKVPSDSMSCSITSTIFSLRDLLKQGESKLSYTSFVTDCNVILRDLLITKTVTENDTLICSPYGMYAQYMYIQDTFESFISPQVDRGYTPIVQVAKQNNSMLFSAARSVATVSTLAINEEVPTGDLNLIFRSTTEYNASELPIVFGNIVGKDPFLFFRERPERSDITYLPYNNTVQYGFENNEIYNENLLGYNTSDIISTKALFEEKSLYLNGRDTAVDTYHRATKEYSMSFYLLLEDEFSKPSYQDISEGKYYYIYTTCSLEVKRDMVNGEILINGERTNHYVRYNEINKYTITSGVGSSSVFINDKLIRTVTNTSELLTENTSKILHTTVPKDMTMLLDFTPNKQSATNYDGTDIVLTNHGGVEKYISVANTYSHARVFTTPGDYISISDTLNLKTPNTQSVLIFNLVLKTIELEEGETHVLFSDSIEGRSQEIYLDSEKNLTVSVSENGSNLGYNRISLDDTFFNKVLKLQVYLSNYSSDIIIGSIIDDNYISNTSSSIPWLNNNNIKIGGDETRTANSYISNIIVKDGVNNADYPVWDGSALFDEFSLVLDSSEIVDENLKIDMPLFSTNEKTAGDLSYTTRTHKACLFKQSMAKDTKVYYQIQSPTGIISNSTSYNLNTDYYFVENSASSPKYFKNSFYINTSNSVNFTINETSNSLLAGDGFALTFKPTFENIDLNVRQTLIKVGQYITIYTTSYDEDTNEATVFLGVTTRNAWTGVYQESSTILGMLKLSEWNTIFLNYGAVFGYSLKVILNNNYAEGFIGSSFVTNSYLSLTTKYMLEIQQLTIYNNLVPYTIENESDYEFLNTYMDIPGDGEIIGNTINYTEKPLDSFVGYLPTKSCVVKKYTQDLNFGTGPFTIALDMFLNNKEIGERRNVLFSTDIEEDSLLTSAYKSMYIAPPSDTVDSGKLIVSLYKNTKSIVSHSVIEEQKEYSIVLTREGDYIYLYINDVLEGFAYYTIDANFDQKTILYIGSESSSDFNNSFNGFIKNFKAYNVVKEIEKPRNSNVVNEQLNAFESKNIGNLGNRNFELVLLLNINYSSIDFNEKYVILSNNQLQDSEHCLYFYLHNFMLYYKVNGQEVSLPNFIGNSKFTIKRISDRLYLYVNDVFIHYIKIGSDFVLDDLVLGYPSETFRNNLELVSFDLKVKGYNLELDTILDGFEQINQLTTTEYTVNDKLTFKSVNEGSDNGEAVLLHKGTQNVKNFVFEGNFNSSYFNFLFRTDGKTKGFVVTLKDGKLSLNVATILISSFNELASTAFTSNSGLLKVEVEDINIKVSINNRVMLQTTYAQNNVAGYLGLACFDPSYTSSWSTFNLQDKLKNNIFNLDFDTNIENYDYPIDMPLNLGAHNRGYSTAIFQNHNGIYSEQDGEEILSSTVFENGSYISSDSTDLNFKFTENFTISFTIKPLNFNNTTSYIIKSVEEGDSISIDSTGALVITFGDDIYKSSVPLKLSEYNFIFITKDGDALSINVGGYVKNYTLNVEELNLSNGGFTISTNDINNCLNARLRSLKVNFRVKDLKKNGKVKTLNNNKVFDLDCSPQDDLYLFGDKVNKSAIITVGIEARAYEKNRYAITYTKTTPEVNENEDQYVGKINPTVLDNTNFIMDFSFSLDENYDENYHMTNILSSNLLSIRMLADYTLSVLLAPVIELRSGENLKRNKFYKVRIINRNKQLELTINDELIDENYLDYNEDIYLNDDFQNIIGKGIILYDMQIYNGISDVSLLEEVEDIEDVFIPPIIDNNISIMYNGNTPEYIDTSKENIKNMSWIISDSTTVPTVELYVNDVMVETTEYTINELGTNTYEVSFGVLTKDLNRVNSLKVILLDSISGELIENSVTVYLLYTTEFHIDDLDLFDLQWSPYKGTETLVLKDFDEKHSLIEFDGTKAFKNRSLGWDVLNTSFTLEFDYRFSEQPKSEMFLFHSGEKDPQFYIKNTKDGYLFIQFLDDLDFRFNIPLQDFRLNKTFRISIIRDNLYNMYAFVNGTLVNKVYMRPIEKRPDLNIDRHSEYMYIGSPSKLYMNNDLQNFKGYLGNIYFIRNKTLYTEDYVPTYYKKGITEKSLLSFKNMENGFYDTIADNFNPNLTWNCKHFAIVDEGLHCNNGEGYVEITDPLFNSNYYDFTLDIEFICKQDEVATTILEARDSSNYLEGILIEQPAEALIGIKSTVWVKTLEGTIEYYLYVPRSEFKLNTKYYIRIYRSCYKLAMILMESSGKQHDSFYLNINEGYFPTNENVVLGNNLSHNKGFNGIITQFRYLRGVVPEITRELPAITKDLK